MAELTVDLTYGKALYDASVDVGKTEEMYEEGKAILEIFKDNPEFYEFVNSPVISAFKKNDAVRKIFDGKISHEMLNFLCVLMNKGRMRHFEKILNKFGALINTNNGFTMGTLFSVNPPEKEQLEKLEEQTGKLLNKKVKLECKTDKNIIGGVRIYIDGKVIDATIKKRLMDLKETLR